MGIVMLGLFALNPNGLNGAVLHMINHGIYSAALFLLVGIIYERRHTRSVAEFGGLSHVMPGYAAVFLAMVMTAIGRALHPLHQMLEAEVFPNNLLYKV